MVICFQNVFLELTITVLEQKHYLTLIIKILTFKETLLIDKITIHK